MKRPNTKLCVLVEPKEFSTNSIIDFCDETFEGRKGWSGNAIVLMTKFDKQLEDSRSGSKANKFFSEYHENGLFPYLTITPTLANEDLTPDELYAERKNLLEIATSKEEEKFSDWKVMHSKYRETCPEDPRLNPDVDSRIGFSVAKTEMRKVMLLDTATRLPEVMMSLKQELLTFQQEIDVLEGKKEFHDVNFLRRMIGNLLQDVCKGVKTFLDGNLSIAAQYPEHLSDLDDELLLELDSEWNMKTLGKKASTDDEERWREIINKMVEDDKMPDHVCADKKYIGGKQYQRAFKLFSATMDGEYAHDSKNSIDI